MRKWDVFIVRFLPIFLFGWIMFLVVNVSYNFFDIDYEAMNLLHSNSIFYAVALFIISLTDRKYHCIWNRAMYIELIFIPLLNYINEKYPILMDETIYAKIYAASFTITLIITVHLALRHFFKSRCRKYGIENKKSDIAYRISNAEKCHGGYCFR